MSNILNRREIGLISVLVAVAGVATAQAIPASISTTIQPGAAYAAFDSARNIYTLDGRTVTAGAAQTQGGGGVCDFPFRGFPFPGTCRDTGIVKYDPSGNVIWATLLGGATDDLGTALTLDATRNVYITGSTGGQFPTTPGAAYGPSAPSAVFAAKVSSDGSKFVYATYLPLATSSVMVVDAGGNTYVAGNTASGHTAVVKLNPDGSAVLYNVVLAGSGKESPTVITLDQSGNILVAGQTTSPDFPVSPNAPQRQLKGAQDNFLVKLDPGGNVLTSSYLGGSGVDTPTALAVDAAGNIDIAGVTSSLDFPTTPGAFQPSPIVPAWNNSSPAGFVAQLTSDGTALKWASYVMSSDNPVGTQDPYIGIGVREMAVTPAGDIYLAGLTGPGFPVTSSAPEPCFRGSGYNNGFLAHLNSQGSLLDATYVGSSATDGLNLIGPVVPMTGNAAMVFWHAAGPDSLSKVQFGGNGWTAPACFSESVLNAATQSMGNGIAPGEIVTLTGLGIGPDAGVSAQLDSQGNIPTQVAGVQVLFDDVPAPVLYAQSRQINAIAPAGLTTNGTTKVSVRYNGQQFGPASVPTTFGSPGIFRLQVGQSAQAVAINQDGTLNGPSNPAPRGSIVAVWGTGYGLTSPTCTVGGLNRPQAEPLRTGVTVLITPRSPTGSPGVASKVDYAGSAPTLACGVVQINFQVPSITPPGSFFFEPWIQFEDASSIFGYQPRTGATIVVK